MAARVFCCVGEENPLQQALDKFRGHKDWLDDKDKTAILKFGSSLDETNDQPPSTHAMDFLLKIYRRHCRKSVLCNSVFHLNDQLVALQLAMAQKNKEDHGEFNIGIEKVLEAHKKMCQQKLGVAEPDNEELRHLMSAYDEFLGYCNASDHVAVLKQVKASFQQDECLKELYQSSYQYVFLDTPQTYLETEVFKLLAGSREVISYGPGQDLSDRQMNDVLELASKQLPNTPPTSLSPGCHCPPPNLLSPSEVAKNQALHVILSYIRLLVNSRDELALARAINMPDWGLGHREFTVLRKVARQKKMPMFQTAVSFVTQIRLGGKSYAPKGDNPFLPITKGLAEFVTFFQKLQNILEENPEPRASVLRIINIIRVSLMRSKERPFPSHCVEEAAKSLEKMLEELVNNQSLQMEDTCSMVGLKSLLLMRDLLDHSESTTGGACSRSDLLHVLSTPQSTQGHPGVRSLLTQFRTPDSPSPEKIQLPRKEKLCKTEKEIHPVKRAYGSMSWARPIVSIPTSPLCRNKESPLENQNSNNTRGSRPFEDITKETPKSHSRKRPAESEHDKENVPSIIGGHGAHKPPVKRLALGTDTKTKAKRTTGGATKGKKKKKPALLGGQKQLTLFFR